MAEERPMTRCEWATSSQQYIDYHDREWGVPAHDERKLFEMLVLEGMQAGLSWSTILQKREGYRRAFANFDAEEIAAFDDAAVESLLVNPEIVRNRQKILATRQNARAYLAVSRSEPGGFASFIWSFVNGRPLGNAWSSLAEIPAETAVSTSMSKELKRRGFTFVGPTICYAFMQAVGLVNDHVTSCFRWQEVQALAEPRR